MNQKREAGPALFESEGDILLVVGQVFLTLVVVFFLVPASAVNSLSSLRLASFLGMCATGKTAAYKLFLVLLKIVLCPGRRAFGLGAPCRCDAYSRHPASKSDGVKLVVPST